MLCQFLLQLSAGRERMARLRNPGLCPRLRRRTCCWDLAFSCSVCAPHVPWLVSVFDSFSRCLLVAAFLFSSSFASVHPISVFSVSFHRKLRSYTSPLVFCFFSFFLVSRHSVPIFSPSPSCFCCGGSLTPQFFCHPLMSFLTLYGSCMKHLPWSFSVVFYSFALL